MAFLTENIKKSWVSCLKGDEVTEVGDHGNIAIVETILGIRLAVNRSTLSMDPVEKDAQDNDVIPSDENASIPLRRLRKAPPKSIQSSFF